MLNSVHWSIYKVRHRWPQANEDGFTLLEVLLALALFGLVVGIIMTVFWNILLQSSQMQTRAELQYDARQCRQYLMSDIEDSVSFTINNTQGNPADQGCHLYLVTSAGIIHYYTYNKQLYRDTTAGTPLPIAENILLVSYFTYSADVLVFEICASKGTLQYDLETAGRINRYGKETIL